MATALAANIHVAMADLKGKVDPDWCPGCGDFGVLAGHMPLISTLRPGVIDIRGGNESGDLRFFVLGGFAEANPRKLTVLAEEAIPMTSVDAATLDQRIKNTEEDLVLAKNEGDRARVAEQLDHLRQLRSAV